MNDRSSIVFGEDGELFYKGRRMLVKPSRFGNGFILNVDGKRIRVSEDRFVLMYTYFSVLFKKSVSQMEEDGRVPESS